MWATRKSVTPDLGTGLWNSTPSMAAKCSLRLNGSIHKELPARKNQDTPSNVSTLVYWPPPGGGATVASEWPRCHCTSTEVDGDPHKNSVCTTSGTKETNLCTLTCFEPWSCPYSHPRWDFARIPFLYASVGFVIMYQNGVLYGVPD